MPRGALPNFLRSAGRASFLPAWAPCSSIQTPSLRSTWVMIPEVCSYRTARPMASTCFSSTRVSLPIMLGASFQVGCTTSGTWVFRASGPEPSPADRAREPGSPLARPPARGYGSAMTRTMGRVLIVAGPDSGGGAGVQADSKAVTAMGAYAATAITAVTVQDTLGVHGVFPIPPEVVRAQAEAVLADIGADAIKTGMLGDVTMVETVASLLDGPGRGVPAEIDPVMVAKGGSALLPTPAVEAVRMLLLPRADLIPPTAPEAEPLTGMPVATLDEARRAGERLLDMGAKAVLLIGGHLPGPAVVDLLLTPDGESLFEGPRIDTRHTHGTGCTLASAIAAGLAKGLPLTSSVAEAWAYVAEAIRQAPGLGRGHGPLDHGWPLRGPA